MLTLADNGEASIGEKRQDLLSRAKADYVSMFDDDDLPAPDYVSRVLDVIDGNDPPDVVGFRLRFFVDGLHRGEAVHSYGVHPFRSPVPRRWARFQRLPNHLNPVRREIALAVGYLPCDVGEDSDYARRLAELKPRETFVDAYLYDYLSRRTKGDEQTHATRAVG